MSFLDDAKKKLGDAVDKHGDKIAGGIDKAADAVDKKTGGKYADKIAQGTVKAKDALEKLDGKNDDLGGPGPPRHPVSQPVPEERNDAEDLEPGDVPPGEHSSDLPDGGDGGGAATAQQGENAESTLDQPSQ